MGLFNRASAALPATRYGYTPPPGAKATSWICTGEGCGRGGPELGSDPWPKRCPECREPLATHQLEEPWQHAAKRVELDARLSRLPGYGDPAWATAEDFVWHAEQALRDGRPDQADVLRRRLDEFVIGASRVGRCFDGGMNRFALVQAASEHGAWDLLAAELRAWNDAADLTDLENDDDRRTNCRRLASGMAAFLEEPRAADSAHRGEVWAMLKRLMPAIREVSTGGTDAAYARLRRVMSGGNRQEEAVIATLERLWQADLQHPVGGTGLPETTVARMAALGRHAFAGPDSGIESSLVWNVCLAPYMRYAQARPGRLAEALAAATASGDGWSHFGAARCVQEFADRGAETPGYYAVLDRALEFLRSSGFPAQNLTRAESERWLGAHGPGAW